MKIKEMFGWLKESNRPKHLKAGLVVLAATFLASFVINALPFGETVQDFAQSVITVVVAMAAVEYAQKLGGGKFDWLDMAAGDMIPVALLIIVALISAL